MIEAHPLGRHNGMNPKFLARVEKKRRAARRQRAAKMADNRAAGQLTIAKYCAGNTETKIAECAVRLNAAIECNEQGGIPSIRLQDIIYGVCEGTRYLPVDIVGPNRARPLIELRHRAICLALQLRPNTTYSQLGRQFGGRDHSTIAHVARKFGVQRPFIAVATATNSL
ncbi:helix-turn-helix domain-containing protein (plasmid) [Brucella anthropi]|uniref:helix-turn-helix domain-containing protein n=1 Tax=Brucella anthropi TaxID=529 RepID=UPI003D7D76CE